MANVTSIDIYFDAPHRKPDTIKVRVKLKPAGEVTIEVPIPPDFYDTILKMAQAGADLHEQKMRAEILAQNERKSS